MLRNRNFILIWLGQFVSILGGRFSELVIPWIVLQITHSPLKAALVTMSTKLAPLVLSLPAGVLVESLSKKKVAILSELTRTLATSMLVYLVWIDAFSLVLVCTALLISSAAGLFYGISIQSILPSITGRDRLVDAHNYLEAADAASTLIGPALAGGVLTMFGAAWTLGMDAFSFLLSLLCILGLRFRYVESSKEDRAYKPQSFRRGWEGLRFLFSTDIQRFVTFNHVVLNFTTQAVTLLIIIYAKQNLYLTASEAGILLSAAGAGNVVGVFVMNKVKQVNWNRLYGSILAVSSIGILLIPLTGSMWGACVGMFVFDGALSMGFVVNGAARQTITPDSFLARVSSGGIVLSGIVGILATGYAGVIAEWVHAGLALYVVMVIVMANSLLSFSKRQLNRSVSSFHVNG